MSFNYIGSLRSELASYLEVKLGAPSEQIILITTMAAAIPFSLLNYFIFNRTARLLYSLIVGFILQYSIYGINTFHTVFGTIVSYYFVKFNNRRISAFFVLIASMAHLSYLNIIRMIVDYGGWGIDDISTIYLIAVAKYSSFAFCYEDGGKDIKTMVNKHHKEKRIIDMPSFLEYSSYIYFYPTTIIGPFIEYKDFINFIDKKDCYQNLTSKLIYIFSQGLQKLFIAIFFIVIFALYGGKYPMTLVGTAEFRKIYPEWWKRILYMYICGPVARSKYYIAWALTYSSLIFSGMSYGETENNNIIIPNVDKGSYGSIIYTEFGPNPNYKMIYWNNSIHIWLKYNVYTRVLGSSGRFKNNKVIAGFITYVFSALWHGFYSSYYISFLLIYFLEQDGQLLNELGFYKYVNQNKIFLPLTILKTTFFIDIIGSIFYCLEISTTKQILINYYGLPIIAIIPFYFFTIIYRLIFKKKKNSNNNEEKFFPISLSLSKSVILLSGSNPAFTVGDKIRHLFFSLNNLGGLSLSTIVNIPLGTFLFVVELIYILI